MLPILFDEKAMEWDTFGIGVLSGTISCEVEENRNGSYELKMKYPVTGALYDQIKLRNLIVAKPNYTDAPQPFRIYSISKPLNGIVTINAAHISYDLSGYALAPFSANGIRSAMQKILDANIVYPTDCPFSFASDISSEQILSFKYPISLRSIMGGVKGSFVDTYGGEWRFDRLSCELKRARGDDRGVIIRYGKNLTDIRQEENNAEVYTAIYPYYYNSDTETLATIPEKILEAEGKFNFSKILTIDLTSEFENTPSPDELRSKAQKYIEDNGIGVPKINLTIEFVQKDSIAERVDLCDTVTVSFDKLNVSAKAKCIRTKWDVLKGRYIEVELGSARNSLAKTIATSTEMQYAIKEHSSQFKFIASKVANKITGNLGGNIVLHDTDNDGEPDELLVMDTDDIRTAVKIIRINNGGIAFSEDGYLGTYRTAWNISGEFAADFIASGDIATDRVRILGDSNFYWDNENITIVNPQNSKQMIRFGKYDGINYGLGFSVDGGSTWVSGFSYDGIKYMRGAENSSFAYIGDGYFLINNSSGINITHIGIGDCVDENGDDANLPFYILGTTKANDRNGESYEYRQAHGAYSFAAGRFCMAPGAFSICEGYDCESLKNYSIALGYSSDAHGLASIAMGYRCKAKIQDAIAIGQSNEAKGRASLTLGGSNIAEQWGGIAVGFKNQAKGDYSYAIGYENVASEQNSMAIGSENESLSKYSIALGYSSDADGQAAISMGYINKAMVKNAIAIGQSNEAKGQGSLAFGSSNIAEEWYGIAIGNNNKAKNYYSYAIGCNNVASGRQSIAIGTDNNVEGYDSIAIGRLNNIDSGAYAFGDYNSMVNGGYAIGDSNELEKVDGGSYGIAVGTGLIVCRRNQIALGYRNIRNDKALLLLGNSFEKSLGVPGERSTALWVSDSGDLTIAGKLTQNSDRKLKTILGAPPDISSVRAIVFKWNEKVANKDEANHIGYIAQDVEKIAPYLVQDDPSGYKTMDYIGLLCAKVDLLERTVESLINRIAQLEAKGVYHGA